MDLSRVRQHLRNFDLRRLFIEELGWDHHVGSLDVMVDGHSYSLDTVAQKRGFVVYRYAGQIPDYPTRRKIERQVGKSVHEHLIIYSDSENSFQVWQWVKREAGKPVQCREHPYHRNQSGDALIQKLQELAFTLEEEEKITIVEVAGRIRAAFDVERVTRRFYDRFKSEHATFLKFIKGIPDEDLHRWYASVMLNRLMFIYFIQKKGFLDGDTNYLASKLNASKQRGRGRFYRDFLCPLFFEGFAKKESERDAQTQRLLGKIPYLNGGIFLRHQIEEQHGKSIQIPDEAFEKLFDFFEQYQWHLDERPLRNDREINPDVLGYIFEKYINQKQMGAYYTKEDITGYISQNTVIPFLFDAARQKCKIAFEGDHSIWRLLQADPDRYIYEAVKRGVIGEKGTVIPESVLPDFVQKGMKDPKGRMFDRRYNLGEANLRGSNGKKLTLPTETWREYIVRRQRCLELRQKLASGEIREINDLITYNLDIRQFAQDVIENSEGPELLRAFWHAIENVTVLDPTVGSGAFLFAALNSLEPLYEACLDRMEVFVDELERSGQKHRPEKFGDFRKILTRIAQHPNRRYFIFKSIIINNLYGVDIMEEAVEICKLRLFLKLVAQVERLDEIEPLPDIDFSIRAGNTLVGYATYEDVKRAVTSKLDFEGALERIEEKAEDVERLFALFRQQQTEIGGDITAENKQQLRSRLKILEDELNRYLAQEYGVDVDRNPTYESWLTSHKPFHWFIEFYGIMKTGGFGVVIGNPPWVEYSKVIRQYQVRNYDTEPCGNLHGMCTERGLQIRARHGRMSFIVQLPLVSSGRMVEVRDKLRRTATLLHVIPCDDRPGKLFEGLEHCRAVLWLSAGKAQPGEDVFQLWTTKYQRWPAQFRPFLFQQLEYASGTGETLYPDQFPKYANFLQHNIFARVKLAGSETVAHRLSQQRTNDFIFYQEATQYWVKATVGLPYYAKNGKVGAPPHGRYLYLRGVLPAYSICALLHSNLFYVYFVAHGDCFHLSDTLVRGFRILPSLAETDGLAALGKKLMHVLKTGAEKTEIRTRDGFRITYAEYFGWKAKDCIDEIDCVLAEHYGFTDEELDFIINYDIKYRMSGEAEAGDE